MAKETKFKEEVENQTSDIETISIFIRSIGGALKAKKIFTVITDSKYVSDCLDEIHDFLLKYDEFFETLDKKFGLGIMECVKSSKKMVSDAKKGTSQIITFASRNKFTIAGSVLKSTADSVTRLSKNLERIVVLPHVIDYSKLSSRDWKMIGVAGIHYRSKVFLSYHFRDDNPKKDENQKMIDYYIKPTLELLNIEPVTARDKLKTQELIDDRSVELIKDCDGIIGFYTEGDSLDNVEHELSANHDVVVICREEGAKAPSMRLSRLLINFKRNEMGDFLIELIRVLKEEGLFRLVV